MSLTEAIEQALAAVELDDRDQALVELARTYAEDIETGGDLESLGPKLQAALDALLMTPKSRAALAKKGWGNSGPGTNPADELRRRRRARRAEAMDPPTA